MIGYFQPELGYEEYYTALTQAKMGHDVSMITSDRIFPFRNIGKILEEVGSEYRTRKRPVGLTELNGIKVYRLPHVVELFYDFILVIGARKILAELKPDIVHAHGIRQGVTLFGALNKDLGYKLVMDEHDVGPVYSDEPTLKNNIARFEYMTFRRRICKAGYKRADVIIPVTTQTSNFLEEMYGIDKKRMHLLQLGANTDIFHYHSDKRTEIRKELGVKDDEVLIATVGRLEKFKKIEQLIESVGELSKKYKLKLLIVGRGDDQYLEFLKRLPDKFGIKSNTIFKGFVSPKELPNYYSAADVGFWGKESITIIEAMACKLPIVIADMLSMKHLASYDNGFTFDQSKPETLTNALEKLISDEKLRRKMSANSLNAVKKNYSYEVRTKKLISIYEKLLSNDI
jgi:glycosyltransferase involved in cell wall biosynthesis